MHIGTFNIRYCQQKSSTEALMKKLITILLLNLSLYQTAIAESITYNNLYLSYVSTNAAESITHYVNQKGLGGVMLWEFRGDTAFSEKNSLLKTISTALKNPEQNSEKPYILGNWSNTNVYSIESTRAIPQPGYGVPGSRDADNNTVNNQDFSDKLSGMNVIAYSFLQAQTQKYTYFDKKNDETVTVPNNTPENIGTLYFNDPWSDLSTSGVSATQDAFCRKNSPICDFALANQNAPIELKDGAKMGNFNAFSMLQHTDPNNPLGPLRKIVSVGGYGHEDSFEDTFSSQYGIDNFVNSAKILINTYQLDGIDLDYENPQMTASNAESFATLVKQLKLAMPDKMITITTLSDPDFLKGTRDNQYGFAGDTLHNIAEYATAINLITYDFYGAFNHSSDQTGTTGFLTNLTIPSNAPSSYHFSIQNSVKAALKAGVPASQLNVGIPAYGRALAGINPDNGGLFNPISNIATIPRGDLDTINCRTRITPLKSNSCSGSFQYKFIINKMLHHGLTEKEHQDNGVVIGTTAYGQSWSSPTKTEYKLKITNIGGLGDLAFNVGIDDFLTHDVLNVGTEKTYTSETTSNINGKQTLTVKWSTPSGLTGECRTKFDFTQNMHIIMKVLPDNHNEQYITLCSFVALGY